MISKEGIFIEGFHCIHVIVPISCEGKRIIKNSANLPNKILLRLHQISWLILAKDYVFFTWIDQYWDLQHSSQSGKANQMKLLFETQPQFSLLSYRECPRWWSFFHISIQQYIIMPDCCSIVPKAKKQTKWSYSLKRSLNSVYFHTGNVQDDDLFFISRIFFL